MKPRRDNTQNDGTPVEESIRRALIEAARTAYERAGVAGLCHEGRWEAALSAMHELDVTRSENDEKAERA